jgi:DNA repair exonuclease SbcCD ATPase subunit
MSQTRNIRDANLEELRKLKSKRKSSQKEPESIEKSSNVPSEIDNALSVTSEVQDEEAFYSKPGSTPPKSEDSEVKIIQQDIEKIPYPEIEELIIKQLKKQLEFLEKNESKILKDCENMSKENKKLKNDREAFLESHEELKKMCEKLQKDLENELEKIRIKSTKFFKTPSVPNNYQEIQEIQNELQLVSIQIEEKDEEINFLSEAIHRARQESANLYSLLNSGGYSSHPDPPPVYSSISENHSQGPRRLLSDVGSTGARSANGANFW